MWRALRHGLDGKLIDLARGEERPAPAEVERLLEWTAPACAELGIEIVLPELNGAQRQRRLLATGASITEIYEAVVAETRATYGQSPVAGTGRLR
jgi:carboxylate-amine ligase